MGHWQYFSWWVVLGLSVTSSFAIIMHAFCFKRARQLRGDKILAVFNILPLFTSILTAVLFVTNEPWTNGIVEIKRPLITDLISFCHQLDSPTVDQHHPLLYQRCLLSDATWIGVAVICLFWLFLLVAAMYTRPYDPSSEQSITNGTSDDAKINKKFGMHGHVKEPHWGRYIPEPVDQHLSHPHHPHAVHHPHYHHTKTHDDTQMKIQHAPIMYASSYSSPPSSPQFQQQQQQQHPDPSYYYHQQSHAPSEKVELYDDTSYTHYNTNGPTTLSHL
ncbi:unnamed protein product [Absidia cylindrospora]